MKKIFLFLCVFFFFPGCVFQDTEEIPDFLMTVSGTIEESDSSFFTSYVLHLKDGGEVINLHSTDIEFQKYVEKEVVLRGLVDPMRVLENKNSLLEISVFDISFLDTAWESHDFLQLGSSMNVPSFLSIKKSEEGLMVNFLQENKIFFLVKKFKEGLDQSLKNGEIVEIGKYKYYRYFSGNQKIFYLPEEEIQIEFWGDDLDIPLFYTMLETLDFSEKKIDGVSEKKENIKPLKNTSILSDLPPLRIIIRKIFSNSDTIFSIQNPVHIQHIEILGSFVSVEYREIESKKSYKILLSAEWKSLFLEELYFHHLAFFTQGNNNIWDLQNGNIAQIEKKYDFFMQNTSENFVMNRPEKFIWYFSSQYNFTIGYPKQMHVTLLKTKEGEIEKIGWSISSLESQNLPEISLTLISGAKENRLEIFDENTIIFPKSKTAYFLLKGDENISFSLLQEIADSLVLH